MGQVKLMCINDSRSPSSKHFKNWIEEGKIYTLRLKEGSLHGVPRVLLKEVRNPSVYVPEFMAKVEPGFDANRFVEIDDAEALKEEFKEEEELCLN
jgi:hypothetical protein